VVDIRTRSNLSSQQGLLRLRTVGRRTGGERIAIVGFIEDGPNLVTPAMSGWPEPHPARCGRFERIDDDVLETWSAYGRDH
jgi:hypothetical protein